MQTILLVEDEANDVFFLKRALKKAQINTRLQVAPDGQEAIDYLQGSGPFADRKKFPIPSIVLLDLKLPHVMGLDVLRWIREQYDLRTIVVIIFSASKLTSDIDTAYQLGANAFLVKPSMPEKMSATVQAIKAFWLDLNQFSSAHLLANRLAEKAH